MRALGSRRVEGSRFLVLPFFRSPEVVPRWYGSYSDLAIRMRPFDNEYRQLAGRVESRLLLDTDRASTLYRASNYSLRAGGKRVRSVLALAVARLAASITPNLDAALDDKILSFASALELLHAASLIHDDLPALDNDNFRRGRPSCHRVYGEGTALLAGDFLISLAIREVITDPLLSAEERVLLVSELTRAFNDLCEGQVADLEAEAAAGSIDFFECDREISLIESSKAAESSFPGVTELDWLFSGAEFTELWAEQQAASSAMSSSGEGPESVDWKVPDVERLICRHRQKTGALILASVLGPLSLTSWKSQKSEQYQALERYGLALGVLFQLTDDLLDVEGDFTSIGKPVGSDERRKLITFVSLLGVERTRHCSELIHRAAIGLLKPFGAHAAFLIELTTRILQRTN